MYCIEQYENINFTNNIHTSLGEVNHCKPGPHASRENCIPDC